MLRIGLLHKFLNLKADEKALFLRAFFLQGVIRLALWFLPLKILLRFLNSISRRGMKSKAGGLSEEQIAWAVRLSGQYVPKTTCLSQALAVQVLLARQGFASNLRIGVAKGDIGQLKAHAWVESEGEVVIGNSMLDHYTKLPPLRAR